MRPSIVSMDIGGTSMRVVAQDAATGEQIGREIMPTQGDRYWMALEALVEAVHRLTSGSRIAAIGVGVAGVVSDGAITGSGNLPDWVNREFQRELCLRLATRGKPLPTVVMNDCAVAALGEYVALRRPLLYVIWGTGVGGSIVVEIDGKPHVISTELGHTTIDYRSPIQCGCGGLGHLEALVSGGNIPQRFNCKATDLSASQWGEVLDTMAVGLRSFSTMGMGYPIVLGGVIAVKRAGSLQALQKRVDELRTPCDSPRLLLSEGGEDSGLIGAAYAARQLLGA